MHVRLITRAEYNWEIVQVNIQSLQGSVATDVRWGGSIYSHSYFVKVIIKTNVASFEAHGIYCKMPHTHMHNKAQYAAARNIYKDSSIW